MSGPRTFTCFLRPGRPATANKPGGSRGPAFAEDLRRLFLDAGGVFAGELLYGAVYYFVRGYRTATDADSDNISKPVWDALEGLAYADDKLVRLRIAGIIDVPPSNDGPLPREFDFTGVPDGVVAQLAGFVQASEPEPRYKGLLYVEVGPLRRAMFRFGLAVKGQT